MSNEDEVARLDEEQLTRALEPAQHERACAVRAGDAVHDHELAGEANGTSFVDFTTAKPFGQVVC